MERKATHLQQMMDKYRKSAKVLAVTSGKGGVGKTNISANLSICLAASGQRALLFEADLALANLDVVMNINNKYNISHVISGRKKIEDIINIGPEGLEIICGASGLEDLANISPFQQQRLLNELSELSRNTDLIIIDTAGGISRSVIGFCLAADHVLVVTTPEAPAMTDAYAIIKVLVKNGFTGRISLLVNMAKNITEGKRTYRQIANVAMRFLNTHIYDAGVLRMDERVGSAVRLRKPVVLAYPNAQITLSLTALAARLSNCPIPRTKDNGFFRKVVDWFT